MTLIKRTLSRRLPLWMLLLVVALGLAATIWFSSVLVNAGQRGKVGQFAVRLASMPSQLRRHFKKSHHFRPWYGGDYAPLPNGLWRNPDQPFIDPGYVLLTTFDEQRERPLLQLLRLRDGKVLRTYAPDVAAINQRSTLHSAIIDVHRQRDTTHNLMMHPLLMADGGLVIHDDKTPLARVDACGKVEWVVDGLFHHSLEPDADGNLWADYMYPRSPMADVEDTFEDDALQQYSPQGKLLYSKRIADILDENGLGELWRTRPYYYDPFHLNDIQPVLKSGPYWQRGDLFISVRNLSMLMLYRPSTGKVLWHKVGPWAFQHDVEILDDHRITVFDNHWRYGAPEGVLDGTNRILRYDFSTDRVDAPLYDSFVKYKIKTYAQGRATPLSNGDVMVEATEAGRLMRLAPDGTIRWRYISANKDHKRFQLRWSRYLDPADPATAAALRATLAARCPGHG